MLAYAFQVLREDVYKKVEAEEFDNIFDLFGAIMSSGCKLLIKRGLFQDYIESESELCSLKGKIDLTQSIKRNTMINKKMICDVDELTFNVYLNQVIKTTIQFLITQDLKIETKKALKMILLYLKDIQVLNLSDINWKIDFNRTNKHYEVLISICYMIAKGMILSNKKGHYKVMEYIDDQLMCRLYERFILEFYRKECDFINTSRAKINWQISPFDDFIPEMQTDITLTSKNKKEILIIDTKYYPNILQNRNEYKSNKIRSSHLYQIFTYVTNKAYKSKDFKVSGMLLYAKSDEEKLPNQDYIICGSKIGVHCLDLEQDFRLIKEYLLSLVEELK